MLCKDTWKKKIPDNKLCAYKQLIDIGLISISKVVYERGSGITTVEYNSTVTYAEVKDELRRRSA